MNGRGDLAVIVIVLVVSASAVALFAFNTKYSSVQELRCPIVIERDVPAKEEVGQ